VRAGRRRLELVQGSEGLLVDSEGRLSEPAVQREFWDFPAEAEAGHAPPLLEDDLLGVGAAEV